MIQEEKDRFGHCRDPCCINYLMTSVYPAGICEICETLVKPLGKKDLIEMKV